MTTVICKWLITKIYFTKVTVKKNLTFMYIASFIDIYGFRDDQFYYTLKLEDNNYCNYH